MNARVHLLPFFVKNPNCRWEWYLMAHYGGGFLVNDKRDVYYNVPTYVQTEEWYKAKDRTFRQEYGFGMGGGVYFWNLFGIYAEATLGNHSLFPETFNSLFNIRAGIEFKF